MELVRYEAARRALAEAKRIDEVKEFLAGAAAMRAYAIQAKNVEMEADALEIRMRAERRLGELMAGQRAAGLLASGGQPYQSTGSSVDPVGKPISLAEAGIDKHLADRARKAAVVVDFEVEVERGRNALLHRTVYSQDPENCDWYTPVEYIEAARLVMGSIDLDPASCGEAQGVVRAGEFFSKGDNGLERVWAGNVWLNPPYGRGLIDAFVAKWCCEDILAGVMVTNNCTETGWFQQAFAHSSAICFPDHRIVFWGRQKYSPVQGQAFFYRGENPGRFVEEFRKFGATSFIRA